VERGISEWKKGGQGKRFGAGAWSAKRILKNENLVRKLERVTD